MALNSNNKTLKPVIDAYQKWIRDCLVGDRSILSSDKLWTPEHVAEVRKAFVDNPDTTDDSFRSKLKGQMQKVSSSGRKLMAEMLWALLVFPSNLTPKTKRDQIRDFWSLAGEALPDNLPMLSDAVLNGIGSGGHAYNEYRWKELAFLIEMAGDLKSRNPTERQSLFSNYDDFVTWTPKISGGGSRQFRHMLRYVAFPDRVERIASNTDRFVILEEFKVAPQKETKKWNDRQVDDALLQLRRKFEAEYPAQTLDFYEPPLKEKWQPQSPPGLSFNAEDCALFTRYPNSVNWSAVSKPDQDLFKSIRERLKRLSESLVTSSVAQLPLKAETSHPTPNGRSPSEIWCCVYPDSVPNKSYGLQIALIISRRGAELCFCQGSGTSQVADPAKKQQFEQALAAARKRLGAVPKEVITAVEAAQNRKWWYRKSWLETPNEAEFASLAEWLQYASSSNGGSASVSLFFTPSELQDLGPRISTLFAETLETFSPILAAVYSTPSPQAENITVPTPEQLLSAAKIAIQNTGFHHEPELVARFLCALATKPFVILTGSSGTGKTKLAQLLAHWLGGDSSEPNNRYAVVPVGADWTDNRNIVGFVNHLRKDGDQKPVYQSTPVLDLLLRATTDSQRPYFLILDEMNLSHIERYFADFLSAMESKKTIPLHNETQHLRTPAGVAVPQTIAFPENLFIIGTVNVDETTYMFSPKVLDRANVLEFRIGAKQAKDFLSTTSTNIAPTTPDVGAPIVFLALSRRARGLAEPPLTSPDIGLLANCRTSLEHLFELLHRARLEFAFRTIAEINRYLHIDFQLTSAKSAWGWESSLDAQLLQKILPKLHGSRRRLEAILIALAVYCEKRDLETSQKLLQCDAELNRYPEPVAPSTVSFPLSRTKLLEMLEAVRRDQFVSFIQ